MEFRRVLFRSRVRDHTLAALRRLDAGSWFNQRYPAKARPRYAGLKIPTLAEVLAWACDRNCLVYVEIKRPHSFQGKIVPYPEIEHKVLEEIERAGVRSMV